MKSLEYRMETNIVPAGSLRWDRFVKSSLASSMVGFIRGGRDESPFWRASAVTSTVFSYLVVNTRLQA